MSKISVGMNLEAVRGDAKPFEWGVAKAAELGFDYIEPMVHWGREVMSEAGYCHSMSLLEDPLRMRRLAEKAGVKISSLQAHGPICRPDVHGEFLKQAIRFAAECGAGVVATDEGIKAPWTTEEEDYVLMRYTLHEAAAVAEPRGIAIGLECHAQYSKTPEGLDRIYNLVKSPAIGINMDTGNAYLANQDPYAWLERVVDRLVHLHAKDISVSHSAAERGKVAGTPVGCACGDGVIDWKRIIDIARKCPRDIVFSVECGTLDEAARSIKHLRSLL
jgi:sugar phosphate isomerase/epimerase